MIAMKERLTMEFRKVIETRQAVRAYRKDPVPETALQRIREAVQIAPTGMNRQPFKVLFVRNPAMRKEIAQKACHQEFIAEAPMLCVVCCEKGEAFNAAIATDHLVLAATDEGLATCWVGWFERDVMAQVVPVPQGMEPCILVPLGYGAETPERKPRKPLEEITAILD
jgi:nitroreductase